MKEQIVADVEERCPCCNTRVEAAQSFDWRYCSHCKEYIKVAEVVQHHVNVDHMFVMEDSDLIGDTSSHDLMVELCHKP